MVEKLVRADWFSRSADERPDKFVVLVDADRRSVEDAVAPFVDLPDRLPDIHASIIVTAAKWHLEAWFFADSKKLRALLGRDLGSVDVSVPDAIEDPKNHLRNLLGESELYTARTCERIAEGLRAEALRTSPSFRQFEQAVRNGAPTSTESG